MSDIKLERAWAMPNKNTFDIAPIKKMLGVEVDTNDLWIDPFANQNKTARITNDLNPIFDTDYNLDALDFLKYLMIALLMEFFTIHHIHQDR